MRTISVVFHPLLMATYSCIFLYLLTPQLYSPIPIKAIPNFIAVIFLTTFLIPVLSILFLKITRKVSNFDITNREERSLPFISIGAFYGVTTYMLYSKMRVPHSLLVMMISVTVLIILIFIISLKFKISVHSAGAWGVAGLFSALSMKYLNTDVALSLSLIYISAGLTTSSRLFLEKHTPSESWSGIFLGFLFCFTTFYLFG